MPRDAATDAHQHHTHDTPGAMGALGGAVFLGMSWTWLVGMMLPVFLIHDFGWPGWVVFAVPNVVGAAAVGFLFRSRQASHSFEHRHSGAMRWFSLYTVVFHLAVAGGVFGAALKRAPRLDAALAVMIAIGLTLLVLLGGIGHARRDDRGAVLASWATLGVSLIVLAWLGLTGSLGVPPAAGEVAATTGVGEAQAGLAMMGPAIALGFLCCPHLDLSIHRVRRLVPEAKAKRAFVLGFGGFFFAMIVGTLLYAGAINAASAAAGTLAIPMALLAHLGVQAALTVGLHCRELQERPGLSAPLLPGLIAGVALGAVFALLPWIEAWVPADSPLRPAGKPLVRLGYEVVITAYALVFPSYLWARVVVGEKLGLLSADTSARAWWIASAVAAPGFAAGYLWQRYVWLVIGVAVLLSIPVAMGLMGGKRGKQEG